MKAAWVNINLKLCFDAQETSGKNYLLRFTPGLMEVTFES